MGIIYNIIEREGRIVLGKDNKKIENLNREECRDLLIILQEKINDYIRASRKNYEFSIAMDRKKEAVEERLAEIEDWSEENPKLPDGY